MGSRAKWLSVPTLAKSVKSSDFRVFEGRETDLISGRRRPSWGRDSRRSRGSRKDGSGLDAGNIGLLSQAATESLDESEACVLRVRSVLLR